MDVLSALTRLRGEHGLKLVDSPHRGSAVAVHRLIAGKNPPVQAAIPSAAESEAEDDNT